MSSSNPVFHPLRDDLAAVSTDWVEIRHGVTRNSYYNAKRDYPEFEWRYREEYAFTTCPTCNHSEKTTEGFTLIVRRPPLAMEKLAEAKLRETMQFFREDYAHG